MKIAFLFSGQGAQYPGMMRELYDGEKAAREVFDAADSTLGRSISRLCFEGTQEDLNLTHNTQPAVLAADLAAGMTLRSHGIEPQAVAGFSLGEYAALAFSGVLTVEDAFKIIQIRADAMQKAVPPGEGAMAAVIGVPFEKVDSLCKRVTCGYVIPANINSPVQTVISGLTPAVDEVLAMAEAEGIRYMKLAVSAPFHCALMEPVTRTLEEVFRTIQFRSAHCPVFMNCDGNPVSDSGDIPDPLVRQAVSPVQWVRTLENMREAGVDTFVECGPGRTLSGLVRKTLSNVTICRVENQKTLDDTLKKLKG